MFKNMFCSKSLFFWRLGGMCYVLCCCCQIRSISAPLAQARVVLLTLTSYHIRVMGSSGVASESIISTLVPSGTDTTLSVFEFEDAGVDLRFVEGAVTTAQ